MNKDINTLIQEQFDSLPMNTREAISRIPWKERLKNISNQNSLDLDKSSTLETETMLVLYSLESTEEYLENITRELNLDQNVAREISEQVFDKIFSAVEEQLEMIKAISQKETPKMSSPVPHKTLEQKIETSPILKTITIEIPPANLPMVEPGEVSHDTTPKVPEARIMNQEASKAKTNTKSAYEGIDPYREPLD